MKKILGLSLLLAFASDSFADETKLNGATIKTVLSDQTLYGTFNNHSTEQLFQKGGATYYSVGNNQSQGAWRVVGDQYCSQWPPNQSWTCYDVMQVGDTISFIAADGSRTISSLTK